MAEKLKRITIRNNWEYNLTLVVFIPHRSGFSFLSDRQNTFENGIRNTVKKIFCSNDNTCVIGCAGSTLIFRDILQNLGNFTREPPIVDRIRDIFRDEYDNFQRSAEHIGVEIDLEMLVVEIEEGLIRVNELTFIGSPNLHIRALDESRAWAIGSYMAIQWLTPQLERVMNHVSPNIAQSFGQGLISYAARVDLTIGSPEAFGCDLITIMYDGTKIERTLDPDVTVIQPMLFSLEET